MILVAQRIREPLSVPKFSDSSARPSARPPNRSHSFPKNFTPWGLASDLRVEPEQSLTHVLVFKIA